MTPIIRLPFHYRTYPQYSLKTIVTFYYPLQIPDYNIGISNDYTYMELDWDL